jgi:hypothetical protein
MTLSVLTAFARFLQERNYSTTMWEGGYSPEEVNQVCHALTEWALKTLQLDGEFLVLWTQLVDTEFSGDSELIYVSADKAYLVPNPFIEGEFEGFVTSLQRILQGKWEELFEVSVHRRILYNAV